MDAHIERLAKLFLHFPGIGTRQAKRFAYFILSQDPTYVATLATALTTARTRAQTCTRCFQLFEGTPGICQICTDTTRDQDTLLVVEKSQDIERFRETRYRGLFFVLGGLIPIIQKHVLAGTNIEHLITRITTSPPKEIILAFPVTPNGEHTDTVVREALRAFEGVVTSLGRGLSTGAELEYADIASLDASLKKRE